MPNNHKPAPVFRLGKRAGYDVSSRRYRTIEGKVVSRKEFEQGAGDGRQFFGGPVASLNYSPNSTLLTKLERLVSHAEKGADLTADPTLNALGNRFNHVMAATKAYDKAQSRPIPSEIRASMRLADFYFRQAGDIESHARTPMEVATGGQIEVQSSDRGYKDAVTDLYEEIDMWTVLARAWMGAAQYGISLPYEVWDESEADHPQLKQIVDLPPYYVWIGYALPFGLVMSQPGQLGEDVFNKAANYALLPFNDAAQWSKQALETSIMPMTFNTNGYEQNENIARGWNIPLANAYLQPVRAFSYGYERYPVVPTSRAFGALGTRMIFDEVVRGTIEGYQNQLWVFTLGTEKAMPRGDELLALQQALSDMAGERTGRFVWRHGLEVNLFAPKSLEQMLAAETRQAFTLEAFRQLGGNIRIETGNPLIGQRETAADKVDLSVWLRRLEWPRRVVLKWERYVRAKIAKSMGPAAVKANRNTRVEWARSLLDVSQVIEQELVPMYNIGWLSPRTGLSKAGMSYEQERQNKLDDLEDAYLFEAPASFSQTTVKPGTVPSRTDSQPQNDGRRMGGSLNLTAAWENDASRQLLMQAVAQSVQRHLVEQPSVDAFISGLTAATHEHLGAVTRDSYTATGGRGELNDEAANFSADFVNAFTDGFRSRLLTDQEHGSDLSVHAGRAMLYATEGYKMAVVNGQRLAMRDRGVRGWKRIVGADACPACKADSAIMHGIAEPFTLVHVNESLSAEELSVQYYSAAGFPGVHIPVPSYHDETTDLLRKLGTKKHTQRRARG